MDNQRAYFATNGINGFDYSNRHIEDGGGKGLHFLDCSFNYCTLERCYFHNAKFERCTFVGVRFLSCNFRSATFSNCDFSYSIFDMTVISEKEVIQNLPYEPNKRRDLIRILRVNAISMGNQEGTNDLLSLELKASSEHHRNVYKNSLSYYNKYSKKDRVNSFFKYIGLRIEDIIWGYGLSATRLIAWIVVILLASGVILAIAELPEVIINMNLFSKITSGVGQSGLALLDLALVDAKLINEHRVLFGALVAVRTTIVGLVITVVYRRYAR